MLSPRRALVMAPVLAPVPSRAEPGTWGRPSRGSSAASLVGRALNSCHGSLSLPMASHEGRLWVEDDPQNLESQLRGIIEDHILRLRSSLEASLERRCSDIVSRLERAERMVREAALDRRPASAGRCSAKVLSTAFGEDPMQVDAKIEVLRKALSELCEAITFDQEHLKASQRVLVDVVTQIQSQLRDVLAAQICLQVQEAPQVHDATGTCKERTTPLIQQDQALQDIQRRLNELNVSWGRHGGHGAVDAVAARVTANQRLGTEAQQAPRTYRREVHQLSPRLRVSHSEELKWVMDVGKASLLQQDLEGTDSTDAGPS